MSRFFFHARVGDAFVLDDEGETIPSTDRAIEHARSAVRVLQAEHRRRGQDTDEVWIEVANADGLVIAVVAGAAEAAQESGRNGHRH